MDEFTQKYDLTEKTYTLHYNIYSTLPVPEQTFSTLHIYRLDTGYFFQFSATIDSRDDNVDGSVFGSTISSFPQIFSSDDVGKEIELYVVCTQQMTSEDYPSYLLPIFVHSNNANQQYIAVLVNPAGTRWGYGEYFSLKDKICFFPKEFTKNSFDQSNDLHMVIQAGDPVDNVATVVSATNLNAIESYGYIRAVPIDPEVPAEITIDVTD